jgi:hypothetical protein
MGDEFAHVPAVDPKLEAIARMVKGRLAEYETENYIVSRREIQVERCAVKPYPGARQAITYRRQRCPFQSIFSPGITRQVPT